MAIKNDILYNIYGEVDLPEEDDLDQYENFEDEDLDQEEEEEEEKFGRLTSK